MTPWPQSRKWREAAGRELFAMGREERLAFLRAEGEKLRAELAAGREGVGWPVGK